MRRKITDIMQWILTVLLIIFGLFIAYQLIKKLLGGSWSSEDIIIALLMFNIGITFTMAIRLEKLNLDHNYLKIQFSHLAKDFKDHSFLK